MSNVLHILLDNVADSSERAAISAGWEIGQNLYTRPLLPSDGLRRDIAKAAKTVSRSMSLDVDLVHGSALLAMALQENDTSNDP